MINKLETSNNIVIFSSGKQFAIWSDPTDASWLGLLIILIPCARCHFSFRKIILFYLPFTFYPICKKYKTRVANSVSLHFSWCFYILAATCTYPITAEIIEFVWEKNLLRTCNFEQNKSNKYHEINKDRET
jgi:hypothetical protein